MDDNKISELVGKYSDMVYRLAFSYMKNPQDAEDATQEVFMKLVEKSRRFENDEHEKAWILRVTVNICKNKLKQFWRRNVSSIEEVGEIADNDEYMSDSDIMKAVMRLPQVQRAAVYLYYYEGYKTPEIAGMLNSRESSVRSALCRAREQLKIMLKEEYDFD